MFIFIGSRNILVETRKGTEEERDVYSEPFNASRTQDRFLFEANDGYNIGRMRGYYSPPMTGTYTFYVYGSCFGQLFISHDRNNTQNKTFSMNPENKVRILLQSICLAG